VIWISLRRLHEKAEESTSEINKMGKNKKADLMIATCDKAEFVPAEFFGLVVLNALRILFPATSALLAGQGFAWCALMNSLKASGWLVHHRSLS